MNLREAFEFQSKACADLGSPFMERLMRICGERLTDASPVGAKLLSWEGDVGPMAQSLPLRLAGGFHALRLQGDTGLRGVYPPREVSDEALWRAVQATLESYTMFLEQFVDSPPQTNEVRRSAALLPAAALVQKLTGLPLSLLEMGASAGLNLHFDRYALETPFGAIGADDPALTLRPEWRGDVPPVGQIDVSDRRGCDLAPVDTSEESERVRLLAYL